MSIINEAYRQGQTHAMEKFAAGLSAANIRGAVPKVPNAHIAATVPGQVHPAHAGVPAAPAKPTAAAPASAAPGTMTGGAQPQGWLGKAWGGLNRVASNPVGQMALGIGAPMLIGGMLSGNSNNQQQY